MAEKVITLNRHIIETQRLYPEATGGFSGLLLDLCLALKLIAREVDRAGLGDVLGFAGRVNVQGEEVKKLDDFSDDLIFKAMDHGGHLCAMASEENESIIEIPDEFPKGNYVLVFDPLDGSSNIDANVSIGTIFGIYRRVTASGSGTLDDFLRPGHQLAAAGYVVYGSSTVLVYTTGRGVHGFTLDNTVGEFLLSHPNIRIPKRGKIYSCNEGNFERWSPAMQNYVKQLKTEQSAIGKAYTSRYIGSLVADFHRNLLYGGLFMYPADKNNPKGKLRLLYEANPLAYMVKQAGGRATDGVIDILDKTPDGLHERTPLFIGSEEDVNDVTAVLQQESAG